MPGAPASPHDTAAIAVYVNEAGRKAMMKQAKPRFPAGSIIVKEKFGTMESGRPELLTVMMKREEGYDPDGGDWEYLVVDGEVSEIRARGALATCSPCSASGTFARTVESPRPSSSGTPPGETADTGGASLCRSRW